MEDLSQCWNEIGIWSKKTTCPKLAEVVHCRNCPVFIREGRRLFDRPYPPEYLKEWSLLLAKEKELGWSKAQTISVLLFRIEADWLALPTLLFKEIVDACSVHVVPHRTNAVFQGMVHIHGQLHLCVSLPGLLGIEPAAIAQNHSYVRLALIQKNQEIWAFHADEIAGVEHFDPKALQLPPIHATKGTYLKGMVKWTHPFSGECNIGLLDEERLFDSLRKAVV